MHELAGVFSHQPVLQVPPPSPRSIFYLKGHRGRLTDTAIYKSIHCLRRRLRRAYDSTASARQWLDSSSRKDSRVPPGRTFLQIWPTRARAFIQHGLAHPVHPPSTASQLSSASACLATSQRRAANHTCVGPVAAARLSHRRMKRARNRGLSKVQVTFPRRHVGFESVSITISLLLVAAHLARSPGINKGIKIHISNFDSGISVRVAVSIDTDNLARHRPSFLEHFSLARPVCSNHGLVATVDTVRAENAVAMGAGDLNDQVCHPR
ncbi:hypothetical protein ABW21_db0203997 [Orbilia brochopaga]|nr:hypothetical protein ABW21_db0203997 [Drechslerella brochopaga]